MMRMEQWVRHARKDDIILAVLCLFYTLKYFTFSTNLNLSHTYGFMPLNYLNSMKRQNDRILKEKLPRSVGAQYATGDQGRNNSRKNEGMEPKQKQYPAVDVTGDKSKVWCFKEQYCIGNWNVRSMNQGELEVVKQEVARVNVDILGVSKLKWTGMGKFNSDDHCIYYCGQEYLRRNRIAIMVNKRVRNAVLGCNLKNDRMISVRLQGKPFNITVI